MKGYNLTNWTCHVREEPDALVSVIADDEEKAASVVYIEPKSLKGKSSIVPRSFLVPFKRPKVIRAAKAISEFSQEELLERIKEIREARSAPAKARAKVAKAKAAPGKQGLLGLIDKITPEGLIALQQAMEKGVDQAELIQILKDNLKPEFKAKAAQASA